METRYLFCVILILSSWLTVFDSWSNSVNESSTIVENSGPGFLQQGTYVVIGVFTYEDNAKSFSQYAQTQGFSARYAYYPSRDYYYVYTFSSDSSRQVVNQCLQLRTTSEFEDAWVFSTDGHNELPRTDEEETLGWGISDEETSDLSTPDVSTPGIIMPVEEGREKNVTETVVREEITSTVSPPSVGELPREKKSEPGYDVFFRTLGEGSKEVTAVVKVVDGAHAKSIKKCQANQPEVLEHARLLTQQVQLITYAIGYRKATFDLSLDNPVNDSTSSYVSVEDEIINVKMPLERLKKGDVQVMFNTYFYGNASVMREKSRYELEELLRFLQENPTTTIKLHGHTNGNSRGITYRYLKGHNNFIDIRRSGDFTKRGVGAKKLSEMRAETIRQYLVKQGIAEARIETKGWGGKQMLYDADSPLAKNNIRVEIEVLSE